MQWLLLLLPWLELFSLIKLGVETSALSALLWVFLTFVGGIALLRWQGMDLVKRLRRAQEGRLFGPQLLVDDMAVGLAGLLLMVPGLITDILALIVLFGPLRRRLSRALFGPPPEPYAPERDPHANRTIEGEYRRVSDD